MEGMPYHGCVWRRGEKRPNKKRLIFSNSPKRLADVSCDYWLIFLVFGHQKNTPHSEVEAGPLTIKTHHHAVTYRRSTTWQSRNVRLFFFL